MRTKQRGRRRDPERRPADVVSLCLRLDLRGPAKATLIENPACGGRRPGARRPAVESPSPRTPRTLRVSGLPPHALFTPLDLAPCASGETPAVGPTPQWSSLTVFEEGVRVGTQRPRPLPLPRAAAPRVLLFGVTDSSRSLGPGGRPMLGASQRPRLRDAPTPRRTVRRPGDAGDDGDATGPAFSPRRGGSKHRRPYTGRSQTQRNANSFGGDLPKHFSSTKLV